MKPPTARFLLLWIVCAVCLFTTTVQAGGAVLQRANMTRASVEKDSYAQYTLDPVNLGDADTLFIVLEPFSGSPQLFVNYDQPATKDDFLWKPAGSVEIIAIRKIDDHYTRDKPFEISVYGFTSAAYGLIAYTYQDQVSLGEGVPMLGGVGVGQYLFCEFLLSDDSSLELSLSLLSGDADLYVSTSPRPVRGNSTWDQRTTGDDFLYIRNDDPNFVPATTYYVSILGFGDAVFSIAAVRDSEDATRILPVAVPHHSHIEESEYVHYVFDLSVPHSVSFETTNFGGDVDLYVSVDGPASKDSYQWKSELLGNDYIHINTDDPNYKQGRYYVAVLGFKSGSYGITALTQGDNVNLVPGEPYSSSVEKNDYKYFKFSHVDTQSNIIVTASASEGSIEIYGSDHLTQPRKDGHDFESESINDSDVVLYVPRALNKAGWYYFGVLGLEDENDFSITVKTNQTAEELQLGRTSFLNTVPESSYRYFFVDVDDPESDLTVTVHSIQGDADLYLSNTIERPTTNHFTWSSTDTDHDSITVLHTDPQFNSSSRFYIGVYGFIESRFSIIAFQSNDTVELVEDEIIPGFVGQDEYVYFSFYLPHSGGFLVELDVQSPGDADLYASHNNKKPSKWHHEYEGVTFGSVSLRIDDAVGGMWYFGVLGVTDASFSIRVASLHLTLDSSPVLDTVQQGNYRNYWLNVPADSDAITASVTLITGATELYVALDSKNQDAGKNHSDASDVSFPGNVLLLKKSDFEGDHWDSTWSLSVFGAQNAAYYVTAGETSVLEMRIPRLSISTPDHTEYFVLMVPHSISTALELHISSATGEVNVYVSQETAKPDSDNNRWTASGSGDIMITMPHDNLEAGLLFIGVESPDMPSKFVTTMYQESDAQLLLDAIPDHGHTDPMQLKYFAALSVQKQEVSVIVESCNDGAGPKFFASFDDKPSSTDPQFISHPDPNNQYVSFMTVNTTKSSEQYLYIAVPGDKDGSDYSIVSYPGQVSREPMPGNDGKLNGTYEDSVLTLEVADSSSGDYPHHYSVYTMEYDPASSDGTSSNVPNLNTVCAVEARGKWHVSKLIKENTDTFSMMISELSNEKVYGINVVVSNNRNLKQVYTPVWLVKGTLQDSPEVESLTLGQGATSEVAKHTFKYFKLPAVNLSPRDTLFITVSAFSGDPDLYVSYQDYPTVDSYDWRSTEATTEYVHIASSDNRYQPDQDYYIGIYGYGAADFTVLAYTTTVNITLTEGQPLMAAVPNKDYLYFQWHLPDNSSFQFTGVPLTGDVDLYADTTPNPTSEHFTWASRDFDADMVDILNTDSNFRSDADYYLGAHGYSQSAFVITAQRLTTDIHRVAMDAVPQISSVESGASVYYVFDVKQEDSLSIELQITQARGDADIYVSTTDPKPTSKTAEWFSTDYGDDYIHITTDDPNYKQGRYYIAVQGVHTTTFRFTVYTQGNNVVLSLGKPFTDTVSRKEYNYFKFFHQDTQANVLLTASVEHGRVSVYVSDKVTKPQNAPGKYQYRSIAELNSQAMVYIPAENNHRQWYYVGVYGEVPYNTFTLTANTNQTVTELINGQTSYNHFVPGGYCRYFVFQGSADATDTTISVAVAQGDGDIFVSNKDNRPDREHYVWKADSYGADSVIIHKNDPALSDGHRLYIGVCGWVDTRFSVMAFLSDEAVVLQDDVPTPAAVGQGTYVYFQFELITRGSFFVELSTSDNDQDADIYVDNRHEKPNKQHYLHSSTSFGDVSLRVDNAAAGKWYFGVLGITDASFSIRATTQHLSLLMDVEPILDTANNSTYRNYRFNVPDYLESFTVSSILVNGVTEMYLSADSEDFPTREHHLIGDHHFPGNTITVRKQDYQDEWDSEWKVSLYGVAASAYMISVSSYSTPLYYSLPRLSGLAPGRTAYYYVLIPSLNEQVMDSVALHVILEDQDAVIDIYVSQQEQHPDANHSKWSSTNKSSHQLVLEKADLVGGYAYIAVVASDPKHADTLRFMVTALREDDPILVLNGFYETIVTSSGSHTKFATLTQEYNELLFLATESCDDRPAPAFIASGEDSAQQLHSFVDQENIHVQYIQTDVKPEAARYTIDVDGGNVGAKYQLYPTGHNVYRPHPGNHGILAGVFAQGTLQIQVTDALNTAFPHSFKVYVRDITNSTQDVVNVHTVCALESTATAVTEYNIDSPKSDDAAGRFFLKISGLSNKKVYGINVVAASGFGLTEAYKPIYLVKGRVHSSPDTSTLVRGQAFYDFVPQGSFDQFTLPAVDLGPKDTLHIIVTELSGGAELYVNYEAEPSLQSSVWNTSGLSTDIINIHAGDAQYRSGKDFNIGVYGVSMADYTIVAFLNSDTVSLIDSTPSLAVADPKQYTYFKWFLPDLVSATKTDQSPTTISQDDNKVPFYAIAESCNDSPLDEFYIDNQDNPHPDGNKHMFTSERDKHNPYLQDVDGSAQGNSYYHIGVPGSDEPFFSLTTVSDIDLVPLPGNQGNLTGSYDEETLTITAASGAKVSGKQFFTVYVREYHGSGNGSEINVNTVCALEAAATKMANATITQEDNGAFIVTVGPLSDRKIYAINIVLSVGYSSVSSAYQPLWLVKGKVQSDATHSSNTGKVVGAVLGSLGGLLLLAGVALIVILVVIRRKNSQGFARLDDTEETQTNPERDVNTYGSIQD